MEKKMFRDLSKKEKKAKLLNVLIQKTQGKLSNEELEKIVNSVDIDKQYKIYVYDNPKEFAEKITLTDHEIRHSWAGGEGTFEEAQIIIGEDIEFGKDYAYQYSNNGNIETDEKQIIEPNFDITQIYVITVDRHEWRKWEGTYPMYDYYEYDLVIYLPEKDYEFSEELRYILENFNIN